MGTEKLVVVAEDDSIVLETLSVFLSEAGYVPYCARNGAEAYELVRARLPGALVTDVKMPVLDGISLLKRMKSNYPAIPVILLTGVADIKLAVEAMRHGAYDFITKPFSFHQVEVALERAIRERFLMEENARLAGDLKRTNQSARALERLNRELSEKIEEISYLRRIQESLEDTEDSKELCDRLVALAAEVTKAERCSLMLLDRSTNTLEIRAAKGIDADVIPDVKVKLGEGIAGKVAITGEAVRVGFGDALLWNCPTDRYDSGSWICVPLKIKGKVFGVLNVTDKIGRLEFTEADLHRLQALAHKAALRMENSALYESIYYNLIDTLRALVTTIDAKDQYTRNHSQRVTEYAQLIASELGLSQEDKDTLSIAGFLHDIGKIGVPDVVLLKPRRLTAEEFEVVKEHPVKGEQIVKHIDLLPEEKAIIRNHHERMDGRGYPDGLAGKEIPLLARIVMAADAFDAMTSSRVYRAAKSLEESLHELDQFSGVQFDPKVVMALKQALSKGGAVAADGMFHMQASRPFTGLPIV